MASLVPIQPDEIPRWLAQQRKDYIEARVRSGEDQAHATRIADLQITQLFPDGRPAPGQHVYRVFDGESVVGSIWIGHALDGPTDSWWVYDIQIEEPFRGRGLGKEAMLIAEAKARDGGARDVGLNVFGHNHVARSLYESLGYETQSLRMSKNLNPT